MNNESTLGTNLQNEKYRVRITTVHTYIVESADNRR